MARPKGSTNKAKDAPSALQHIEDMAKEATKGIEAYGEAVISGYTITERFDEPCGRNVFDVSYGDVTDKGFLTREAAEAHVAEMKKA
jgi:hypothetical protein